jgi:hypothetical protein
MSIITVDREQGMAADHGELWLEDNENAIRVVVDMSLEEDDQFCIAYNQDGKDVNLYVPLERLRALLRK